eukprot:200757-Pelagomonas_calceolata.AAC.1
MHPTVCARQGREAGGRAPRAHCQIVLFGRQMFVVAEQGLILEQHPFRSGSRDGWFRVGRAARTVITDFQV